MKISQKNILVVGDIMIDQYEVGSVSRVSPEAPVPVFLKNSSRFVLGGAANVAANIKAAQQRVSICSVIGKDEAAHIVVNELKKLGVEKQYILQCENRKTTTKTRIVAQNNQQLLRIDAETTRWINIAQGDELICQIEGDMKAYDAVILSDYCKGLLSEDFCQKVICLANRHDVPVLIDVKDKNLAKYNGAYLLKPNLLELATLSGMPVSDKFAIKEAAMKLLIDTKCKHVLTTLGGDGMQLCSENEEMYMEKSEKREVYDVSGAGDTAIAYLTAGIASGWDIKDAIHLANVAAGIKVTKLGTSPVYLREVLAEISNGRNENRIELLSKIINIKDIDFIREAHKGQRVVFTNGCFDILHMGHVTYLNEASRMGDILIVGLNSDASVKRLKGVDRPINDQEDRAGVLAALGCVDFVVIFNEDTPETLIKQIVPNVLVKGGDYIGSEIVGSDFVRKNGGVVITIPLVEGKSTTKVIESIHTSAN